MKIRVLILLVFSFNYVLFSQNNTDDLAKETSQPSSVLGNDDRFFYVKNGDYILKKNYKNILLDSFLFDKRYPNKSIKLVFQNDAPVIVSRGGGMVWKVKNDTFKRADKSYNHKMTNQSTVFVRNDTLMKFGGYGYWSRRNFFTYYSETSREWEYYPINYRTHFPPGVSDVNSTYSNDYFYFSGGLKSDPKSALATNNDNVWRFNFKNKLWTNLGVAKFNTRSKELILDIGNGRHLAKNEEFNNFIYDYNNNKISQLKGLNPTLGFNTGFVANDSLYNYRNNQLIGLSLADYLTTDLIEQGTMYIDTNLLFADLRQFTGVALIILFIVVLFLYSKNRKRPRLSETGFRFNRVHYPLSKNELMVLNLILYNKRIESKTLLKKIYDTELSVAQNNRRKIEIVESLNQKVSSVMGVKNFINSKKSLKDQRMLIYYSNFRTEFIL
tara:strand:- start:411 stop:1733 length:1323 start_codon:yes stop_codon:yes gene_type:complete